MSNIQKEIDNLLKFAKLIQEEAIFQQKASYKAFKAKKVGHRSEIKVLINGLRELDFPNECIFWLNKYFQERVCSKEEKIEVLVNLCELYHIIENYSVALEFGQKFLEMKTWSENLEKASITLNTMVDSCRHLSCIDGMVKYQKLKLKIEVKVYNKNLGNYSNEYDLMKEYFTLISIQFRNCDFSGAMKTIGKLKLYNLNSKNPNDIRISLNKNENRKNAAAIVLDDLLNSNTNLVLYLQFVLLLHEIGRICLIKSQIYIEFGDMDSCLRWAKFNLELMYELQTYTKMFDDIQEHIDHDNLTPQTKSTLKGLGFSKGFEEHSFGHNKTLIETIFSALTISCQDLSSRNELYSKVFTSLLKNKKFVSYYIGKVSKHYNCPKEDLLSFVQFCINHFDEAVKKNPPSWPIEEGKKNLFALKNSIVLQRHIYNKLYKEGRCLENRLFNEII